MNNKNIFTFFVIVIYLSLPNDSFATNNSIGNCVPNDSSIITIPSSLSLEYYNTTYSDDILYRNYNYKLINKRNRYLTWSKMMMPLSLFVVMGGFGIGAMILGEDPPLWGTLTLMGGFLASDVGIVWLFYWISTELERKAYAIEVAPIVEIKINKEISLNAVVLSDNTQSAKTIGIGIKTYF